MTCLRTSNVYEGRRSSLMVSALVPGANGPGSSPGRGQCVVFLGKTCNSHSASLHPGQEYKWVPTNCWGKRNKIAGERPATDQHPVQREQQYSQPFHAAKTGDKLRRYEPVGSKALFLFLMFMKLKCHFHEAKNRDHLIEKKTTLNLRHFLLILLSHLLCQNILYIRYH